MHAICPKNASVSHPHTIKARVRRLRLKLSLARRAVLATLLLLLTVLPAVALDVPQAQDFVNDRAAIISADIELKLNQYLREFEQSDSTQLVVLTIPTLEGETLEEYALNVLETWGIGQQDKDNGALLLIARDERKIRIEVGYGLEGALTDLLTGRIIDNEISPSFKEGDFDGGIVKGVVAMAEAVRGEYQGSGSTTNNKDSSNPFGLIFILFFLGPALLRIFARGSHGRSSRRGPFIGGGFGGGRGGFGGGGFSGGGGGGGGGGASGGW
jgi:uncharacterized protein